jgi:hypothetical protein
MVATVGSISIDLSTNTAKFTQGFKASATTVEQQSKRMSNAVNGFSKASKAASGIVSGFIGGIAAGGALAALGSLSAALGKARQSLSDFEEIGNRAKATGLGTETFQAISHGAALADVEQESLNKSLEIFAKNAGLAEQGTGAMYAGLKKLNPELLRSVLHATDQEQRLKLVADAMAGMTDATEKAALATAVFGRGGAEMVRVLDKGSQSIEQMKRQAQELGIIIPEDLIARAGELDDKLTTLSKVVDVNLSQALVKAAPLLVGAAQATATFATELNEVTTAINAFVDNPSMAEFGKLMSSQFFSLTVGGKDVVDIVKDIAAASDDTFASVTADIKEVSAELDYLIKQGEAGFEVRVDVDKAVAHLDVLQAKLTSLQNQARATLAEAYRASENASMAALDAASSGGSTQTTVTRYGGDTGDIDADLKRERDDAARWGVHRSLLEGQKSATTDVGDDVDEAADTISGTFDSTGHYITGRYEEATRTQTSTLVSALNSLSRGGGSGGGSGGSGRGGSSVASDFSYSGNTLGTGGSTSWAGRRFTYSVGGDSSGSSSAYSVDSGSSTDASSITSGSSGDATINVSIVVKPVLEGQRLSAQSTAEIKQAAAAGANAALRAYNGR